MPFRPLTESSASGRPRPWRLAILAMTLPLVHLAPKAGAQPAPPKGAIRLDAKTQSASSALTQFDVQSGTPVGLNRELSQDKQVSGSQSRDKGGRSSAVENADASGAGSNRAPATSEAVQLGEVKVTGDWLGKPTEEAVKTYPGARTAISERELNQAGMRNVEDALRLVPGVRVQDESGVGILPNIGVRGLNPTRSQRALVLVDGVPIALAPYGQTGLSLFPLTQQTIQSIDVARGGVAVRYGPNNVGGVINFLSKPIPERFSASLREALTIGADTGNVLTDSYLRAGGFVSDTFGLQFQANTLLGDSFRAHSGTEVENLMLDADWFVTDSSELKGRLQYYNTDTELPGGLTPEAYKQDRFQSQRPLDKFQGDTLRGQLIFNQTFGDIAEFNWTNFAHTSDRKFTVGLPFDPAQKPTGVQFSPREFLVYGTEPRLTLAFETGWLKHKVTVGGRYLREESDQEVIQQSLATGVSAVSRDFRFETDAWAVYVNDTLSLFRDRLTVTPGLRVEWVDQLNRNNLTGIAVRNRTADLLPGFDVGYALWPEKLFVFGNVHQSLQPVQFTQITLGGDVGAERSLNYEAGFRLTPLAALDLGLTYFRFEFDNQIEFDSLAKVYRNLGESRHQGYEVEANWRPLAELNLKAGYTYVDTEQLTNLFSGTTQVAFKGNELPFSSHHQFTLQGNYRLGTYHFNINGSYLSSAFTDAKNTEAEDPTGTKGKIPSYWVWNAQVSKDFRWNETSVKVGLAANNLFNENYYFCGVDTSNGRVPGPGRSVMLSLQLDL